MRSLHFYLSLLVLPLALSSGLQGQITITELDLANNQVEIINSGTGDIDISNWWICNRFNGSPFYSTINSAASINTLSSELSGAADLIVEAGDVLVLDIDANFLTDSQGEFAFYNTNSFGNSTAIEEYITWGATSIGVRDSVAQGAGIWTDGDFIDVTSIGAGDTIQLTPGQDSSESGDYIFESSTLGSFSTVPEPGSLMICGMLSVGLLIRRRR